MRFSGNDPRPLTAAHCQDKRIEEITKPRSPRLRSERHCTPSVEENLFGENSTSGTRTDDSTFPEDPRCVKRKGFGGSLPVAPAKPTRTVLPKADDPD
jgi:hypothetical protein